MKSLSQYIVETIKETPASKQLKHIQFTKLIGVEIEGKDDNIRIFGIDGSQKTVQYKFADGSEGSGTIEDLCNWLDRTPEQNWKINKAE